MSHKVLVPFDGSSSSKQAVQFAISSLKERDSILLINVQRPQYEEYQRVGNISKEELDKFYAQRGEEILQKAENDLKESNCKYEKVIKLGLPSLEITKAAKENSAHSIIMGSRGMSPVLSNALGSVTYSVLHLAPCPVTIVPCKE
ncbi:universal stress protein [Cytobacillus sp. FJAT-54145]|uniref:Universal stress protein n=1 Tax=Cytobacillus spartinae TaxID=3299023 RepID=A0ABW6KL27_9BACI